MESIVSVDGVAGEGEGVPDSSGVVDAPSEEATEPSGVVDDSSEVGGEDGGVNDSVSDCGCPQPTRAATTRKDKTKIGNNLLGISASHQVLIRLRRQTLF